MFIPLSIMNLLRDLDFYFEPGPLKAGLLNGSPV